MAHDLQIANIWKRMSAWLFDGIMTAVIAVAMGLLLSALLGYDGYSARLDAAYAEYENQFGITFEISQETYETMSQADREAYNAAYEALVADEEAMYAYNMMISLSMVIISLGILFAVVLWEFVIPLWLGHGRTLGKKIFGLALVRSDGVQMNTMQLFTRSILGKFSIETMIPVLILLMIFWGTMGMMGTLVLATLTIGQVLSVLVTKSHSAIHDLLAGTVVVDYASQTIFRTTEDLIEHKKRIAKERADRSPY
jgi:uncharacterized RDD family membrane protein YckC